MFLSILFMTVLLGQYFLADCYIIDNREIKVESISFKLDTLYINNIKTNTSFNDMHKMKITNFWDKKQLRFFKFTSMTLSNDTSIYYSVIKGN
jgi:hypothetical protein